MWNYDIGEEYPCPNCSRYECNGCFKKRAESSNGRTADFGPANVGSIPTSAIKGNEAFKKFMEEEVKPPVEVTPMDQFKEWGRQGGLKGGAVTAKRGPEYFRRIASLPRKRKLSTD